MLLDLPAVECGAGGMLVLAVGAHAAWAIMLQWQLDPVLLPADGLWDCLRAHVAGCPCHAFPTGPDQLHPSCILVSGSGLGAVEVRAWPVWPTNDPFLVSGCGLGAVEVRACSAWPTNDPFWAMSYQLHT